MADITVTAANVKEGAGKVVLETKVSLVAVTAMKAVLLNDSDKYVLADSNVVELNTARGVALHSCAAGQRLTIAREGQVIAGATLTPGAAYYLSDTPGGICPDADVGTGENVCLIGYAIDASVLDVKIVAPGVSR